MTVQPAQFAPVHASIFGDASVVDAYAHRPPYPPETFDILMQLIDADANPRTILDAGCGPGPMARALAPRVNRVDAVDIATRMIEAGRRLPGGDHPRIRWLQGAIEELPLQGPYALIVAAASLQWMTWRVALPRFHQLLTPNGVLAVVDDLTEPPPWREHLDFVSAYSLNADFQPYTMLSVTQELANRGLFQPMGLRTTAPVTFRQSIEAYVESFHARNGLSRDRMTRQQARAFDDDLRTLVMRYCPDGMVTLQVRSQVIWGRPLPLPSN